MITQIFCLHSFDIYKDYITKNHLFFFKYINLNIGTSNGLVLYKRTRQCLGRGIKLYNLKILLPPLIYIIEVSLTFIFDKFVNVLYSN